MYKALNESIRDSEKLANLSDFAYRVWNQGLATSDMMGRIASSPKKFWAIAMPLVPFDQDKVVSAIAEIAKQDLVHFYEVDGKKYMVYHNHDEHNKGTKNLRHQRVECPPPPPTVCYCVSYTKDEEWAGDPLSAVATAVPTAVATATVPVPVHVPEGVQGEPKPPASSPEGLLAVMALNAKVIHANERQLRTYVAGWLADKGFAFCEELLMSGKVNGKDLFWIHDTFFKAQKNGKPAPGARKKIPKSDCQKCRGSGRRLNPVTNAQMDCSCVKEVYV